MTMYLTNECIKICFSNMKVDSFRKTNWFHKRINIHKDLKAQLLHQLIVVMEVKLYSSHQVTILNSKDFQIYQC